MSDASADVLRVVQWTTGNVAVEVVKALSRRPDLELVGAYAYSPDKVGVDVGTLCGRVTRRWARALSRMIRCQSAELNEATLGR